MTGPDFALAVLIGLIANAIYDVLRNPALSVPKNESSNLLQDSQKLIRKVASRILPSKKEEDARPVVLPENQPVYGREAILKKSEVRHADQSFVFPKKADVARPIDVCQLTHPDSDHLALGAFLKKSFI